MVAILQWNVLDPGLVHASTNDTSEALTWESRLSKIIILLVEAVRRHNPDIISLVEVPEFFTVNGKSMHTGGLSQLLDMYLPNYIQMSHFKSHGRSHDDEELNKKYDQHRLKLKEVESGIVDMEKKLHISNTSLLSDENRINDFEYAVDQDESLKDKMALKSKYRNFLMEKKNLLNTTLSATDSNKQGIIMLYRSDSISVCSSYGLNFTVDSLWANATALILITRVPDAWRKDKSPRLLSSVPEENECVAFCSLHLQSSRGNSLETNRVLRCMQIKSLVQLLESYNLKHVFLFGDLNDDYSIGKFFNETYKRSDGNYIAKSVPITKVGNATLEPNQCRLLSCNRISECLANECYTFNTSMRGKVMTDNVIDECRGCYDIGSMIDLLIYDHSAFDVECLTAIGDDDTSHDTELVKFLRAVEKYQQKAISDHIPVIFKVRRI